MELFRSNFVESNFVVFLMKCSFFIKIRNIQFIVFFLVIKMYLNKCFLNVNKLVN